MRDGDLREWFDVVADYPARHLKFDPPLAYLYQYVTSDYAQAMANCMTTVREAWLLRRYTKVEETEDGWERVPNSYDGAMDECSYFGDLKEAFFEGYDRDSRSPSMLLKNYPDDVVLLGEVEGGTKSFWSMVWLDQDTSDCQVARMPKAFEGSDLIVDWRSGDIAWEQWRSIMGADSLQFPKHVVEIGEKISWINF